MEEDLMFIKKIAFYGALVLVLAWCGVRIYKAEVYDIGCGDYLKRAADASSPQAADAALTRALAYMESNGLTEGYTSVVYRSPDEDVGYWHSNVSRARDLVRSISPTATLLEQTNVMIRVREILIDQGQSVTVTEPDGISIYPNNKLYAAIFLLLWLVAVFLLATERQQLFMSDR